MRLSFRLLFCSTTLCAGFAPVVSAFADPVPVIAVNREIGLSMTGTFRNSTSSLSLSQAETGSYSQHTYTEKFASSGRYRTIGWTPGFQADASVMFNAFGIDNLYGALHFSLEDGQRNYKSPALVSSIAAIPFPIVPVSSPAIHTPSRYSPSGNDSSSGTDNRGEIGKGFLLLSNSFLLTPFIQGGYVTNSRDGDLGYGSGRYFAGAGLKADYALTSRLVLRGRFGWAEVLSSGLAPRPLWEGGLGVDYRMTRRLHLTAGGNYSYFSYGHDRFSQSGREPGFTYSYSGVSNGLSNEVKLHAGLAWQF